MSTDPFHPPGAAVFARRTRPWKPGIPARFVRHRRAAANDPPRFKITAKRDDDKLDGMAEKGKG